MSKLNHSLHQISTKIVTVNAIVVLMLSMSFALKHNTTPAHVSADESVRDLRIAKARVIASLYPDSGIYPYLGFLIDEHERQGIGEEWYWSMAYSGANFSMKVGGRAPGRCYGPMDVKGPVPIAWRPKHTGSWSDSKLLDPRINIAVHVAEMAHWKKVKGARGYKLVQTVFYPKSPRDWGGGKIAKAERRHRAAIQSAYKNNSLPPTKNGH